MTALPLSVLAMLCARAASETLDDRPGLAPIRMALDKRHPTTSVVAIEFSHTVCAVVEKQSIIRAVGEFAGQDERPTPSEIAVASDQMDALVRVQAVKLPHTIGGVVKEQVELSGHIAEFSQEHSHLAAVMDSVIGAVLHQLTQRH